MKYLSLYRIASVLLVLFFVGHTAGGMLSQKSISPGADAVFHAMKTVQFNFKGATCTWYGFWFGFGLTVSVFLLFSAIAAWQLDKVPPPSWPLVSTIAWALAVSYVCTALLSWAYFFAGSGLLATAVALLLGAGAFRKQMQLARGAA